MSHARDADGYSGLDELLNAEVMKNYNSSIVSSAINYSKGARRVVDFGAGIGTLALIFKESHSVEPLCVEIDETNKSYLSERNLPVFDSLSNVDGDIELIFSSNTLEHIEDDISVLDEMGKRLSPSGRIFLYLPAKMFLWSGLDEKVRHYRRYELAELRAKLARVGLNIEVAHYADSIGFFALLAIENSRV